LRELQEACQTDRKTGLFENLPPDGVFDPLQVIDFAPRKVPASPLWRSPSLDEQDASIRDDRSAAADANATLSHAPMAARMRAQERAPLWNDARSYFSFGEWTRSSSSAKPTSRLSIFSSRLNQPTTGIEPPLPTSAAGFSHSVSSAR